MARKAARKKQAQKPGNAGARKASAKPAASDPGKAKDVFQAALEEHRKGNVAAALAGYA